MHVGKLASNGVALTDLPTLVAQRICLVEDVFSIFSSKSAESTKIDPHVKSLLQICEDLQKEHENHTNCLAQARFPDLEKKTKEFKDRKGSIETSITTTVSDYKNNILDAVQKVEDGITTVVTGFSHSGTKDANLDVYKTLLSENLLKHITHEIQEASHEPVLTETNTLLSEMSDLSSSFGLSGQNQRIQAPFDSILKTSIVSMDDLNEVETGQNPMTKVLKTAKYTAMSKVRNKRYEILKFPVSNCDNLENAVI
ncbi:uncharacterized protein LOC127844838 [Dreissena polymorpha]|uniref:uncharacterized protein LOC127844838 n=1 Tax=Dreissena polymorpha TaxID=45954 RepID=UPI0022651659|nr:uncharacterized protein LOC127844838 [Dreissena polymorpha]